jgi:thiopeptide-type bacteriocin biosynthesis protein
MPDGSRAWLSVHLFFDGNIYGPVADRVILDLVAPLVREAEDRGWLERHFFVRYSEGGPHIRLRLFGRREFLEEHVRPLILEGASSFTAIHSGVRSIPIPYEPEFDRYGGPEGIALAERFFHASSNTAFALLQGIGPTDGSARLGKALLAMVVLTHAFYPDRADAAAFLQLYGTRYLRSFARSEGHRESFRRAFDEAFRRQAEHLTQYVVEGWARLERGESVSPTLDPYVQRIGQIRLEFERLAYLGRLHQRNQVITGALEATGRIVPSYLHMMSNRIGVSVPHEAYLSDLIQHSFFSPVVEAV